MTVGNLGKWLSFVFGISHGITVSYTFANFARVVVAPETQTMWVQHAHKEKIRLGELMLSEQAALNRYSQLRKDTERNKYDRFPTVPRTTQDLWVRVCD